MKESPRLSVYVITYNQEDVIHRTMESLLKQKEYIYEICINDDCSKDKTYKILLEYQRQYPEIVKPVQNIHNLGIFANTEAVWQRLEGDIIYGVSGDDESPQDYLKEIFSFIENNKIDWKNEAFCIYGDYKQILPDGSEFYFSNDMVQKKTALSLAIRGLINNRSAVIGRKVFNRYPLIVNKNSYSYEGIQDRMLQIFTDKTYYIPVLGNIYYTGIGVSGHMNEARLRDRLNLWPLFLDYCNKWGVKISTKDCLYIKYRYNYQRYVLSHNRYDLVKSILYFVLSIRFSYGIRGLNVGGLGRYLKRNIADNQKI